MGLKAKLIRSLSRATCDKPELNQLVLRYKKCFDEAAAVLSGKGCRKK